MPTTTIAPWDDMPIQSWNDRKSFTPDLRKLRTLSINTEEVVIHPAKFLEDALPGIHQTNDTPVYIDQPGTNDPNTTTTAAPTTTTTAAPTTTTTAAPTTTTTAAPTTTTAP